MFVLVSRGQTTLTDHAEVLRKRKDDPSYMDKDSLVLTTSLYFYRAVPDEEKPQVVNVEAEHLVGRFEALGRVLDAACASAGCPSWKDDGVIVTWYDNDSKSRSGMKPDSTPESCNFGPTRGEISVMTVPIAEEVLRGLQHQSYLEFKERMEAQEYEYELSVYNSEVWGYGPCGDMTLSEFEGSRYDPECN